MYGDQLEIWTGISPEELDFLINDYGQVVIVVSEEDFGEIADNIYNMYSVKEQTSNYAILISDDGDTILHNTSEPEIVINNTIVITIEDWL